LVFFMSRKDEKTQEAIRHAAAEFLKRESNRTSLITITNVVLKERGRSAVILFTVLPEEKEPEALAFLKRQRSALRGYVAKRVRMQRLPLIDCALDVGERNRQKLEELSQLSS
jgi:ribosome-binding factor A